LSLISISCICISPGSYFLNPLCLPIPPRERLGTLYRKWAIHVKTLSG
jgi:hypothetical protein